MTQPTPKKNRPTGRKYKTVDQLVKKTCSPAVQKAYKKLKSKKGIKGLLAKLPKELPPPDANTKKLLATLYRRQPRPAGTGPDIAKLVHAELEARVKKGAKQYGQRLKAHNGRDALWDAYEEAIDMALYLRQAIFERDNPKP
jgi:hypothetical protein